MVAAIVIVMIVVFVAGVLVGLLWPINS